MNILLAIESSCDDTGAAVSRNGKILSNVVAGQVIHRQYGGVVPELASRAHQRHIVPVVQMALEEAGVSVADLDSIAFTRGPGLMGSLLVGVSFAKAMALSLEIPLIEVNHLHAHLIAHFIDEPVPPFPFLCLLVSGGHTQIIRVEDHLNYQIIGRTIDDAAGEAFDKAAKVLDLPYPGGPLIDKLAREGNRYAFHFTEPSIPALDYSFSGLKTSLLYFLRDRIKEDEDFIKNNLADICASYQHRIVDFLLSKLRKAAAETGIRHIAIAGGVAANSELRRRLDELAAEEGWATYIPAFEYCTDNAAMIAMAGHFKWLAKEFAGQDLPPFARVS
ncbi:MAG: tRNA (adenosine(37)-N6)-threonylcarbamoyltransferase complex transferase subunit TsaD [Bacteroidia bacterium]